MISSVFYNMLSDDQKEVVSTKLLNAISMLQVKFTEERNALQNMIKELVDETDFFYMNNESTIKQLRKTEEMYRAVNSIEKAFLRAMASKNDKLSATENVLDHMLNMLHQNDPNNSSTDTFYRYHIETLAVYRIIEAMNRDRG